MAQSRHRQEPLVHPDRAGRPARRSVLAGLGLGAATTATAALRSAQPSAAASGTFGVRDDGRNFVVDTGAQLVFKVSKSAGDLVSFVYRGTEYQGYAGKNSQVEIGLGGSTVKAARIGDAVVVSVAYRTLRHYYVARSGQDNVYMFTDKADATVTATRYIVRFRGGVFTDTGPDAWVGLSTGVIEAQDVVRDSTGVTHSKHYSGLRVIDYDYVGRTNGKVGIWLVRSNHEKASGGPFYRSLLRDLTSASGSLYEILYYGEAQTEAMRFGLQGPYVLAFTDGGAPSPALFARNQDTRWVDGLGIPGWVPTSRRGRVAGVGLRGMAAGSTYTVGFANDAAQYWTIAAAGTGRFSCDRMLPGTYRLTVHKGELAVRTGTVTVAAGAVTTLNTMTISGDPASAAALWRIGTWDGTPLGFKNADLMTTAHPSDVRARPWKSDFTVGRSAVGDFPCYLWRDVNNGVAIRFRLTAAQAASGHTVRIGVTAGQAGGRPRIRVNDWISPIPPAPSQPGTRALTVGTYRENNLTYAYAVPASAWKKDPDQDNVLTIEVVSGTSSTGWLSPAFSFDAVDLLA